MKVFGVGVKLPEVSDSGTIKVSGVVVLLGVSDSGTIKVSGVVVLLGVSDSGTIKVSGAVVLSGVVLLSEGGVSGNVLPEAGEMTAVPPGQREFRGERSHRIFIPSGESLISVGELVDKLLESAIGDLLDWAKATLVVSANVKAVPIRVRDFPFILKFTSTETEHSAN
jgi:hypothetical protein